MSEHTFGPCSCQDAGRCLYINGGPACMNSADQPAPTPRTDANLRGWKDEVPAPFVEFTRQLERELSAAKAEAERLREALTVHLSHYSTDGYRIPTDEFMREVVKESRAALAATRKEEGNG